MSTSGCRTSRATLRHCRRWFWRASALTKTAIPSGAASFQPGMPRCTSRMPPSGLDTYRCRTSTQGPQAQHLPQAALPGNPEDAVKQCWSGWESRWSALIMRAWRPQNSLDIPVSVASEEHWIFPHCLRFAYPFLMHAQYFLITFTKICPYFLSVGANLRQCRCWVYRASTRTKTAILSGAVFF